MRNSLSLYVLNVLLMVGVVVTNILANALPINGLSTKQVSDLYPGLFTPEGFTFSIWGMIYIALICFLIYGYLQIDAMTVNDVLPWFAVTSVLNISWILSWHHLLPVLSVVIMLILLTSLGKIFQLTHSAPTPPYREILFVRFPFTIYFAWICVATIANISALLVHWDWGGGPLSPESWTIVMMTIAAVISGIVTWRYRDWAHGGVTIWALFGIFSRWTHEHSAIRFAAGLLIVALSVLVISGLRRRMVPRSA